MVDVHSQILGMTGSLSLARNPKYSESERNEALVYAHMHACQAAVSVDVAGERSRYLFRLDDYKHEIKACIIQIMNGTTLDDALKQLPAWS